jgi:hypothetical protein
MRICAAFCAWPARRQAALAESSLRPVAAITAAMPCRALHAKTIGGGFVRTAPSTADSASPLGAASFAPVLAPLPARTGAGQVGEVLRRLGRAVLQRLVRSLERLSAAGMRALSPRQLERTLIADACADARIAPHAAAALCALGFSEPPAGATADGDARYVEAGAPIKALIEAVRAHIRSAVGSPRRVAPPHPPPPSSYGSHLPLRLPLTIRRPSRLIRA